MFIRVDYYAVNKMILTMQKAAKEVEKELNQMEETFDELSIFWNGESSAEFTMRFNADIYIAKAMLESIKKKTNELIQISKKFNEAEREIEEMIYEM